MTTLFFDVGPISVKTGRRDAPSRPKRTATKASIDLDDAVPFGLGIQARTGCCTRPQYRCADDLHHEDGVDVSASHHAFEIFAVRQRLRRRDHNRIARMHAERIEVLHVAHGDAVVSNVSDDLRRGGVACCRGLRALSRSMCVVSVDEAGGGLGFDFDPSAVQKYVSRRRRKAKRTPAARLVLDLLPASEILIDQNLFCGRTPALQGAHASLRGRRPRRFTACRPPGRGWSFRRF